ncbi:MAG: GFA family protein [Myxococcales bacterium]|nr:GFA family protein [Myxococcales bacterium]
MKSGGCLCGAVRYELRGASTSVTYCHCAMCRRWHGHVGAYAAVDRTDLVIVQPLSLKWHASSPNVRRGFCAECGSSLFFDDATDGKVGFCAGTLDEPTDLRSKAHIFVASKGDYYELGDDGLLRLDGSP